MATADPGSDALTPSQRFSRIEVQQVVDPLRARIAELEQLNRELLGDDPAE